MKFMKLGSKPDAFHKNGNIRYVATELAADITVNVGDVKFHLHKFPLLSKSARLHKLLSTTNDESDDGIHISDIPGGASAFEICAKFCYGMSVTLNAYNVATARCAAEYLEMYDTIEKGNLVYKIEVFLTSSIFRSWKDSIIVLQSARSLLPWCEDLKIVSRCIDSIASRVSIDPSKVEWSYTYTRKKLSSDNNSDQCNGVRREQVVPKDWWVEDLCELEIDFYKRVITSIKSKGSLSSDIIGDAVIAYASRRIPSFAKGMIQGGNKLKFRLLVEAIVWMLPAESGSVPCSFLLRLLKATSLLCCGEIVKKELVKRIGQQLSEASVNDLLIPTKVGEDGNVIYDVDVVQSMVEEHLKQGQSDNNTVKMTGELHEMRSSDCVASIAETTVAKLIDGYLVEVARDPNLPMSKFVNLAEMVPKDSRPVHDGIYRAIDMYLKEHPGLNKGERKRMCKLMDCRKLSVDASMHAVQNDRLPLRVIVQVLFLEQLRSAALSAGGLHDIPEHVRSLLPTENSQGFSRSATAAINTDKDRKVALVECDSPEAKTAAPKKLHGKGGSRDNSSSDITDRPGSDSVNISKDTKSTP